MNFERKLGVHYLSNVSLQYHFVVSCCSAWSNVIVFYCCIAYVELRGIWWNKLCGRNWRGFDIEKATFRINVTRSEISGYYLDPESNQLSPFLFFLYFPVTLNKHLFIAWPDNERITFDQMTALRHTVQAVQTTASHTSRVWISRLFILKFFPARNIQQKKPLLIAISLYLTSP